ncbi:MAG: hypothetical protein WD768_17980 [Phycisphaeraceae bacterium]
MLNTIAFILGWILLGIAGLFTFVLGQMGRDRSKDSTLKNADNQMMFIGLVFVIIVGGIGALMVWLTYPV